MFRVPVVDLVGWIRASFKPADQVVLKIDVEGVEHEIFEALTQGGGWDPELKRTLRGLRWVRVRTTRTSLPRWVRTGGAGRLAARAARILLVRVL